MCPTLVVALENARTLLGRQARTPARLAPLVLALAGLLASTVAVRADQVSPQGTMNVNADSADDPLLFGDLIILPRILEDSAAEWADGSTITIDAPDHFAFATDVDSVTAQVVAGDVLLVGQVGDTAAATPTATQIQFTVDTPGQSSVVSTIEFAGIRLRATDAIGATMGTAAITVTTAGTLVDATLVQVTVIPGDAAQLSIDPIASPQMAGVPFNVNVCAEDQYGNPTTVVGDTVVRVYVDDGSGGLSGDRDGTIDAGTECLSVLDGIDVSYDTVELNVTLIVFVTSGDDLVYAVSNAFDVEVNPGDVDMDAVSLTLDGSYEATLTYAVTAPEPVDAYIIRFFLEQFQLLFPYIVN